MALTINNNNAAMNAHRNLLNTSNAMAGSIERLSSGFKINRAADDPAGLVISENLRAQSSGLGQAIKNSNDAINMVKTAEGALTEVHSVLRGMRDLAVHAANTGANDVTAVAADQAQIKSSIESLNRISSNTSFGNIKLLDGSAGLATKVSAPAVVGSVTVSASNTKLSAGSVSLNVTTAATKATVTGTNTYATSGTALDSGGVVKINGTDFTFEAGTKLQDALDTINAKSDVTGVVASFTANAGVTFTQTGYGSNQKITMTETADVFNAGVAASATGADAVATLSLDTNSDGTAESTVSFAAGKGNVLQDAEGNKIVLNDPTVKTTDNAMVLTGGSLNFQIGANAGQTTSVSIASTAASNLGLSSNLGSVADIDVAADAQKGIKILDAAITQVSTQRAQLGSFQKNLESNINSLGVAKENVTSSESSIRDADMAEEMVGFTRNQIMSQAGTSMLTQANQAPQGLLSLLR